MCISKNHTSAKIKIRELPADGIRHCHLTNASDALQHARHFKSSDVTLVFFKDFFVKVIAFRRLAAFMVLLLRIT